MKPNFNIWYTSDEVKDYHPIVEWCLQNALNILQLDNVYSVAHHYEIPGSTTIPDFAIVDKNSERVVFIIEVKKSKSEVESQRYWNQTRGYVRDLKFKWKPNTPLYYCITNIEELLLFCERDAPISNCLLKGNPYEHDGFDADSHNAEQSSEKLTASFVKIIELVHQQQSPDWVNNWDPLVKSFIANYMSLANKVSLDSDEAKEISLYELLRLLFYAYLREYYLLNSHSNSAYFSNLIKTVTSGNKFGTLLQGYYDRVLQLDFKQIFSEYPLNSIQLIKDDAEVVENFKNFIISLERYIKLAIKENSSPPYLFSLLSSEIYEREELHNKGKVMTDSELATLLAEFTLSGNEQSVIDPGCGDGSLLSAAYDRLMSFQNLSPKQNHQELVGILHGREIDPFLSQLATFRILAKNFESVSPSVELDILASDIFRTLEPSKYDAVLINPPFLRNDDQNAPITNKGLMLDSINKSGIRNFVEESKQPNLLYYFLNYSWHYLKPNGRLGAILMTKVLNNQDGIPFKRFIRDKVELVIQYPSDYFPEFKVTTCIIICNKEVASGDIKFVNVKNTAILENISDFSNEIKKSAKNHINPNYSVKFVNRNEIKDSDNWRLFLIDPEDRFSKLNSNSLLVDIQSLFSQIKRGQADNSGGTNTIFFESNKNPLLHLSKSLSKDNVIPGLKNNRNRRNFELKSTDLFIEKAVKIPSVYAASLDISSVEDGALKTYLESGKEHYGVNKWKRIISEAHRSTVDAKIIIPRADRTKHSIYLNNTGEEITISSNFIYLAFPIKQNYGNRNENDILKCITAYLLSSFGQIQFEILSNNQEGMRKFEKHAALKLKVIDPKKLSDSEIEEITSIFDQLKNKNTVFSGLEITNSPRSELDLVIAKTLFTHDHQDYKSFTDLLNEVKGFLFDLVEGRGS